MKKRILILDFLRGLAVIGMVVYHLVYLLDFAGVKEFAFMEGGWLVLARVVQFLFLGLVGVSLVISWKVYGEKDRSLFYQKQLRRAMKILGAAMLVSLGSFLVVGDLFIKFGILHGIAVMSLMLMFFVKRPWWCLVYAFGAYFLGQYFQTLWFDSFFLYVLGMGYAKGAALDYFPVFPWSAAVAVGIFLGQKLKGVFEGGDWKGVAWVNFVGRNALGIYLLHVPVTLALLWLFGVGFS